MIDTHTLITLVPSVIIILAITGVMCWGGWKMYQKTLTEEKDI